MVVDDKAYKMELKAVVNRLLDYVRVYVVSADKRTVPKELLRELRMDEEESDVDMTRRAGNELVKN